MRETSTALPDEWTSTLLKRAVQIPTGLVDPTTDEFAELRLIAPNHIESHTGRLLQHETADEQGASSGKFLVHEGEIIYSKIRPALNKACIAPEDCLCSADMYPIRPREGLLESEFLLYALLSRPFLERVVDESMRVAMPKVNRDSLGGVAIPLPPLPTQRAIASFLDRETEKIDTLIEKKRRLLELLEEKRTALITLAVIRGLDPDVPMKDSGVEWLGEIPEHWDVVALKRLWRRADYGISDSGRDGGLYPVLTMGDIHHGAVTVPEDRGIDEVPPDLLLKPGDLLFNRTNSRDLVGKVGLYEGDPECVTFASYLVRLRPNDSTSSRYLNYLLNSAPILTQARSRSLLSVNQANLNPTRYGEIPVPRPPRSDQKRIVDLLRRQAHRIDQVLRQVEGGISLLQEYRTALISAAVTGKIDVRDKVPA